MGLAGVGLQQGDLLSLLIFDELIQRTDHILSMLPPPDYPTDTNTSTHTPPEKVPTDQPSVLPADIASAF